MRKIRVVFSQVPSGWPVLVLATLAPMATADCGSDVDYWGPGTGGGAGQGGAGGTATTTSSSVSGEGGLFNPDSGFDAYTGPCPWDEVTFTVPTPGAGVPAETAQICAAPEPVSSSDSARITLVKYSQSLHLATGMVTLAPALVGLVTAPPTIEVYADWYGVLEGMQVSNLQPVPQGFTFHAEWPTPFNVEPDELASMAVRVTLQVPCPGNQVKLVQAYTYINLCLDDEEPIWVSSGDECTTCTQVCEMAPGPITPPLVTDRLPLARALQLGLKEIARIGRSSILLAENDGGPGLEYRWEASGGEVTELAPDLVVWTRPSAVGRHHLRVAALAEDAVAVASFCAA